MSVRWLKKGLLVDEPVGAHHRIPMSSVLALRDQRAAAGRSAMEVMAAAERGDPASAARVDGPRKRAQARMAGKRW